MQKDKENLMFITEISFAVALEIAMPAYINGFFHNASLGEFIWFTHTNFYYSGKSFLHKESTLQYHRVTPICKICGAITERNYAGYGTVAIVKLRDDPSNRMTILCCECIRKSDYKRFGAKKNVQLKIF